QRAILAKWTQPALVRLPSAAAQYGSGGTPQPPLCKGGTAWQSHAGGIVKPGYSNQPSLCCPVRKHRLPAQALGLPGLMRCNPRCSGCPEGARVQSWQSTQQKRPPIWEVFFCFIPG